MLKVMLLGSRGMAGHMVDIYFRSLNKYNLTSLDRKKLDILNPKDILFLKKEIAKEKYDVIINCIGVLIEFSAKFFTQAILVNSWFPHLLETLTENTKTKVIHLSTDCVFRGDKLVYSDNVIPDGYTEYAKTKIMGELYNDKDLTLRTSIIGPELKKREEDSGLLEWFLRQTGDVTGYGQVFWSGITTLELAKQLDVIISYYFYLNKIYHLSVAGGITKYELLSKIKQVWGLTNINLIKVNYPLESRLLGNTRQGEYLPNIPSYTRQLEELKGFLKTSIYSG
jgi:dTDP-4-dehydrorhamnose reductase